MLGYFITLEGIEGSGKTTQVAAITDKLKEMGYDPIITREPGGCELAEKIRAILLDPENKNLVPMAELFLYLADRAQHVKETIWPAMDAGKVIVCDRFADATIAYQGFARGLGPFRVSELNRHATDGLAPDLTILFDLPVEVGLGRANGRIEELSQADQPTESRFEQEKLDFHQKVRDGYLELARIDDKRYEILDASQSPEAITEEIFKILETRLDAWKAEK